MLYIVQQNMMQDRDVIIQALRAEQLPYHLRKTGMDRQTFKKEPRYDKRVAVPLGSVNFIRAAKKQAWGGVWWFDDTFNYRAYVAGWGVAMLNHDAEYCTLKDVSPFTGYRFIRPVADSKLFSGTVVEGPELTEWRKNAVWYQADLGENTEVLVSEAVNLDAEWRTFIVDGQVVTGSQYHRQGRLVMDAFVPSDVLQFAQASVERWQPSRCFTLDITRPKHEDTLKILEAGCLNASGVYKADFRAVLRAVEGIHPGTSFGA